MTSTEPLEILGAAASVLAATVYQGGHESQALEYGINWQHMWISSLNFYIGSRYWVYNYMLNVSLDDLWTNMVLYFSRSSRHHMYKKQQIITLWKSKLSKITHRKNIQPKWSFYKQPPFQHSMTIRIGYWMVVTSSNYSDIYNHGCHLQ